MHGNSVMCLLLLMLILIWSNTLSTQEIIAHSNSNHTVHHEKIDQMLADMEEQRVIQPFYQSMGKSSGASA